MHPRLVFAILLLLALAGPASAASDLGGFPRNYTQIISEAPVDAYPGVPFVVSHNDVDLRGQHYGDEEMVIFYINYIPSPPVEGTAFNITMLDGTYIEGDLSLTYNMIGPLTYSHTVTLTLMGDTITFDTPVYQGSTISLYPVKNDDDPTITGLVLYAKGFTGGPTDDFLFYPCNVRSNPMIAIETENADIDAGIYGGPIGAYYKGEEYVDFWGNIGAIKDFIFGFLGNIYFFLEGSFYWFHLIFIQNFMLLIALYEAIGLALAAGTSRDIFQFFKKAWNVQVQFVNLFMFFVRLIEEIILTAKEIIFKWV